MMRCHLSVLKLMTLHTHERKGSLAITCSERVVGMFSRVGFVFKSGGTCEDKHIFKKFLGMVLAVEDCAVVVQVVA